MKSYIPDSGGRRTVRLRGSNEASCAWWVAGWVRAHSGPVLYILPDSRRLRRIETNMRFFLAAGEEKAAPPLCTFPAWDVYPYARLSPSSEILGQRLKTLDFLIKGGPGVILTTPEALAGRLPAPVRLLEKAMALREGQMIDRDELISFLEELMYHRRSIVESPGEYAYRGGIVDFFSPHMERPVRLELKGDEIDSLRDFHPQTQRTLRSRPEVSLFPAREVVLTPGEKERAVEVLTAQAAEVPELALRIDRLTDQLEAEGYFPGIEGLSPLFVSEMNTLFDFVPRNALWVCDDAEAVKRTLRVHWNDLREEAAMASERGLIGFPPEKMWLAPDEIEEALSEWPRIDLDALGLDSALEEGPALQAEQLFPARGGMAKFAEQLFSWRAGGNTVALVAADRTEALRAQGVLRERELSLPLYGPGYDLTSPDEALFICEGALSASFRLPAEKRVFYRTADLFAAPAGVRPRRRTRKGGAGESLRDLKPDDFVVHVDHGVGRFIGAQVLEHTGSENEFLAIVYAGADKLYVPMDDIDRVHIYRGAASSPPLDRLGGGSWEKTKKGVKKAIRTIARDLLRLYADRASASGHSFAADGGWDQEISAGFEYEETPDQDRAIRDVLTDMESTRPMDRLICGDVGYGKTEVALRAAARAVSGGKQVALIVPTTLLAHQHWETFRKRFEALPVCVEMLSRFRSRKEQTEVVAALAAGGVDIVIGTHRLLQKDIAFKDLGLLVIDEEHRFGVAHKEKLKKIRVNVDVLTMTATPIPRTLQMALSGTRDMSVIETPPRQRLAPRTYIARFTERVVGDAIRRELDRGGQVFFVHNRVKSLPAMERFLKKLVPEARIATAHGQMPERKLEEVMEGFISRKADVLLCTTIIESGLDIPSVNTILINRADYFGMAQLYQLRGRVGRDRFQAHAYLLVPGAEGLSPEARERLKALEELSELGAGFRLAARDLEIRGAGNLLGHRQSGQIAAVGFEMYCQLLEQVIQEAKGGGAEQREPELVLPVAGSLPMDWMPAQTERLESYRRIAAAESPESLGELGQELADRFGPLPMRAKRLLQLAELRIRCRRCGLKLLQVRGKEALFEAFPGDYALSATFLDIPGMQFVGSHSFRCSLKGDWEENFEQLAGLLDAFAECLQEDDEEGEVADDPDAGKNGVTISAPRGEAAREEAAREEAEGAD